MSDKQEFSIPHASDTHAQDKQHIRLTCVINYYLNKDSSSSVLDLLSKYSKYPSDLLDVIQFVVVDDGLQDVKDKVYTRDLFNSD